MKAGNLMSMRFRPILSAAVIAVLLFAGNAFADFEYGANSSLSLSIFNETTNRETGYDLGVIGVDFTLNQENHPLGSVDVSDLDASVVLFSATSAWQTFVGTSVDSAPEISTSGIITQQNATRDIFNTYQFYGNDIQTTVAGGKTAAGYFGNGGYAGFVIGNRGVPVLSPLADVAFIDIYLYQYDAGTLNKGTLNPSTDYAAVVRINADGSVVLNPPVVNQAPTAAPTASRTSPEPGQPVNVNANASDDNDDPGALTYTWTQSGYDGELLDIDEGWESLGSFSFTAPDVESETTITFSLTVTDTEGLSSGEETVQLTIIPATGPTWPPASVTFTATPSALDAVGGNVALEATTPAGWNDGELTWTWSTTYDGITIADTTAKETSFTAPANTGATAITIPIKLQVSHTTHGDGPTATKNVTVNPAGSGTNNAPTITDLVTPATVQPGQNIRLSAKIKDTDGDALSYIWSNNHDTLTISDTISTGTSGGVTITETYQAPDEEAHITFTLSVTDAEGGNATKVSEVVTVKIGTSKSTIADAGPVQFVQAGDTVTLDGRGSYSTAGIKSYAWKKTQGSVENLTDTDEAVATFKVPDSASATTLAFELKVTAFNNETNTDTVNVYVVTEGSTPPQPDAGANRTVWENQTVFLDGSDSIPNGNPTYQWTREGTPAVTLTDADTMIASFTAPVVPSGQDNLALVFKLTMTDQLTNKAYFDTVTITVEKNQKPGVPTSALAPVVEGAWESAVPRPAIVINNVVDPDGDALTYDFDLFSHPEEGNPNTDSQYLISGARGVPEGDGITIWTTPALAENTLYHWRARAAHPLEGDSGLRQEGDWMDLQTIFINTIEEPPGVAAMKFAGDNPVVTDIRPTLTITNAVDPDRDQLAYELRLYDDPADPIDDYLQVRADVMETTNSEETTWSFDEDLNEDRFYWVRARATDDTGLSGDWMEPTEFFVSTENNAPEAPIIQYPGDEIDSLDPVFTIESSVDPEDDPVAYTIKLDTVESMDGDDLVESNEIEAVDGMAQWQVPESLTDNTLYFYSVTATDKPGEGLAAASSETKGIFFVNLFNDPPYPVKNYLPSDTPDPDDEDKTVTPLVTTTTPKLVVQQDTDNAITIPDPDRDSVKYEFEVFLVTNLTTPVENGTVENVDTTSGDIEWIVSKALTNGKKYYWHARAVDEHGVTGEWSAYTSFIVAANQYQPSAPQRVSPIDGSTVNTLTPTLVVVATEDGDGNDVWVEFELYRDEIINGYFVAYESVVRGETATSWSVDTTLDDQTDYYWRARATDGEKYSSWTSSGHFRVDLNNSGAPQVRVWEVTNYDATVPWYTVMEVDDPTSSIYGTRLVVPPGALSYNETLYVGEAIGGPSMDPDLIPVSKVLEFGPTGTQFNVPVTLKIPYTDEDLAKAGGITPAELMVYTYNEIDQQWEMIAVDEVDEEEKLLICEVDHFSLYSSAASADGNSNPGNGDPGASSGGGGGGCFIGAAGAPVAGGGVRWLIAAMLSMSLVVRRR